MIVEKIIFSCDGSYYPFWEPISEVISKVLNVQPVLFFINDHEETDLYEDKFGLVKKVKSLPNYSSSFLGQIYRLYGTKFFTEEVCLISDMDMLLFNKNYLVETISKIKNNDDLVVLNSDAYDNRRPECYNARIRFPICYLVGKGKTFDKILNTNRNFSEFAEEIYNTKQGWDSDEIFFTDKLIDNSHGVTYHLIKRGYCSIYYAPGRIEKYMFYDCKTGQQQNMMFKLNLNGSIDYNHFIDCHIPRGEYELLEKLKNEIISFYK